MTLIEPLDLQELLVNTFAGNMFIFSLIALIFITMLAAKFRMNGYLLGMIVILFGVIMFQWITWLLPVLIVFGGIIIMYQLMKPVK